NRALEFMPDDETLVERKAAGKGLTRPELSVLISYTKAQLKSELAAALPDDLLRKEPLMSQALYDAFPPLLRERFPQAIEHHRLRREIIATQIANDMIDMMGIPFVERMTQSTGATIPDIARAY